MNMSNQNNGVLESLKGISDDYCARAKELNAQGAKIIGYLCALTPKEVITAAGLVPFRIKGDVGEPISKADTQMETIVCPLVRSCYDITLKGNYNFLSGIVIPHACDSICRTYDTWKNTLNLPYNHMINMPHSTDDSSLTFYKELLNTFRKSIGNFAGKSISDSDLSLAITSHNNFRAGIRKLSELRKTQPPLISGTEIMQLLIASMGMPVEEATSLINKVSTEIEKRNNIDAKKSARIMVVGAQVDDHAFIKLIEDSGGSVVIDDLCPGTRENWSDINQTDDPMDGIAERYLRKVKCGRTYREPKGSYQDSLEDRFDHIAQFIKDFKVEGVILYTYKYCDPFGFEIPALKSYVKSINTPVLYLEDEYSMATIGRLRTRIQAFLEMLGS
jgi:benzoyl-CoA reductase subunit C